MDRNQAVNRLIKNREYYSATARTVEKVGEEIDKGLAILNQISQPIVTFFGSHRVGQNSSHYKSSKKLAEDLGSKGYAILSGGGPGIMHAANTGATTVGAVSVGFQAELLTGERVSDDIFDHKASFHFLFVRRFLMSIKSDALIFFPGGYGTLNELFEYAVLMQTGIVDKVPIICVNKKYWEGLFIWLKDNPLREDFFIHGASDLEMLHFVDDVGGVSELISR